jgi:hypothetical protein
VRRGVARHDDALALQVGEAIDARGPLGDDPVVAIHQREEETHVRVVAEHAQHLRRGISRGMRALQRDGAHTAVDDAKAAA